MDETAAAAPAALAAAQRAMRHAYRGGCYGQLASGLVWTASAALATWGTPRRAIVALVVGGMGIYPATLALMRLDGRHPPSGRDNPLLSLGAQVALVLPASMPVLAPLLAGAGARAFFPAMLVLVGAHYLPFVFLYGMPAFAVLAAVLVAAGVTLATLLPSAPFAAGAWVGAGALLLWAALGRWLADREAGA